MGALRQPVRQQVTTFGVQDDAAAPEEEDRGFFTGGIALFVIFIALVVATLWYVARPALDQTPSVERSCEVVISTAGSPDCVEDPARARVGAGGAAKRGS
jgi:hypothetical protein